MKQLEKPFHIADLGCSIGPVTFFAMENIIEAIKIKHQSETQNEKAQEYFVFFNDHFGNDFNALFNNLPKEREYIAAAVPGSFHAKLFPRASLDVAYSSNAIHWLSGLPKDVTNASSPAYNKGRIFYTDASPQVCHAFSAQFAKDFESFIAARAEEMESGGLLALLFPGRLDGVAPSGMYFYSFSILESCLLDMTKEGIVNKESLDSFNIPLYFASPQELKHIIERNKSFDIVKFEIFQAQYMSSKQQIRSVLGRIFGTYFEIDTVDELFERYGKKIKGLGHDTAAKEDDLINIFIVLKHKKMIQVSSSTYPNLMFPF